MLIVADGNNLPGKAATDAQRKTKTSVAAMFEEVKEIFANHGYHLNPESVAGKRVAVLSKEISKKTPKALKCRVSCGAL